MLKKRYLFLFSIFVIFILVRFNCHAIKELPQCVIIAKKLTADNSNNQDSITVIATRLYEGGILKNTFQGEGYRKAWATPITIPKVRLDTLLGGLTPIKKGGGNQTQSLKLRDSSHNVYTLRTVNKDPSPLIPDIADKLGLAGVVTDGISAQHPYGGLVLSPMSDAIGLWNSSPHLVYLEPQIDLDSFNHDFKDRMYFLEYETDGVGQWTGLDNVVKITSTEGVQKLASKHDNFAIDTANLIRARLFDLLIGDWDRHAKNWGWIVTQKDEKILATVMACDRDNAFYGIGGVVPSIINRPFIQPLLRPFREDIDYMPGMIKPFDSYFLYGVSEDLFLKEATFLQENLTDKVIENAMKHWPTAFYDLDGKDIVRKIKARRQHLQKYAREFHQILEERGPLKDALKGSTKFWEKQSRNSN